MQTSLIVGTQAHQRGPLADYDVVSVMNQVIGGGPTGRLFMILREEKGYTYGAYSGFSASRFRGSWSASTDVRTEVTEAAFRDLMAQIARMRDEPVPDKEFQAKKRGMVASFALSLEARRPSSTTTSRAGSTSCPPITGTATRSASPPSRQAQVQAAASKYLDRGRLQIVAVGDPKIGDSLKQFGTVDTYDTNGTLAGK